MELYNIRVREVLVFDVQIKANTYKEAFLKFQKKLDQNYFTPNPDVVRLNYEVESITTGNTNDYQHKRSPDRYRRPTRTKSA